MNDTNENQPDPEAPEEIPLCPNCFTELDEYTRFCPKCAAPIGGTVMFNPIDRYRAFSFEYTKARGPSGKRRILPALFVLGPMTFMLLYTGIQTIRFGLTTEGASDAILSGAIYTAAGFGAAFLMLYAIGVFEWLKETFRGSDEDQQK